MPYANNNGIRIHYEVEGSGPPLLLHHGEPFLRPDLALPHIRRFLAGVQT
jgi:pimeloyl-ACP methyl ester carboxylesterase